MSETYKTPFDLIAAVKRSRGEDVGPMPFGYADNRSLEPPEGPTLAQPAALMVFPDDHGHEERLVAREREMGTFDRPGTEAVPFRQPPAAPHFLRGDYVQLSSLSAHLDKYDCRITEAEAKAIRTILLKAIRRELRALEKTT